jgi:glycogen synthase
MPGIERILYAAGPGNVLGTYEHWRAGEDDPSQVHVTYSGQFFDVCRDLGLSAYVIASCPRKGFLRTESCTIEHRPVRWDERGGILYHLGRAWYGLRLLVSAIRFGADVALVSDGTHWFTLRLFSWAGIRVVPSLHCVLRAQRRPPGPVGRAIEWLDRGLFQRRCEAILSASGAITRQVIDATGGRSAPILEFLPLYRAGRFEGFEESPCSIPWRILYAGRIERNKGVFDLLGIALAG